MKVTRIFWESDFFTCCFAVV